MIKCLFVRIIYMKEKILIIEDDRKIADLVKLYLEKENFETIIAYAGKDGLEKFFKESPQLVILDLMLPEIDGLTIAKSIRSKSDCPIIMLTAKDEESDKIIGLELGADDYISKPFSPKEMVARVKAVMRRTYKENKGADEIIIIKEIEIYPAKFEVKKRGRIINLTRREFKLLLAFTNNPGKMFSRSELMKEIYTMDDELVFDRTIDVHIANLRRKINDKDQRLITTIIGMGYKLAE